MNHDIFYYHDYTITKQHLHFSYSYKSTSGTTYSFSHTIAFKSVLLNPSDPNMLRLAFFLGISIIPYYYSLHCAKEISIQAGKVEPGALTFFENAFTKGLAELKYQNNLDVTEPIFIHCDTEKKLPEAELKHLPNRYLISNGGGKDSLISGELLHAAGVDASWFVLGYNAERIQNILPSIARSPYRTYKEADQLPDPYAYANTFKKDHPEVYLGHKPFNIFLSFLGTFVAYASDYAFFVTSNESAANTGNVILNGVEVNHQYSKSLEYEKDFRTFLENYLNVGVTYFSAIRPFSAEQIGRYFTRFDTYFSTFISCNTGIVTGKWCNNCPKCCYVFLLIYASRDLKTALSIFGRNLIEDSRFTQTYLDLLGLGTHKPFECVGEIEEVRKLYKKILPMHPNSAISRAFKEFLATQSQSYATFLDTPDTTFQDHFIPALLWETIKTQAGDLTNEG